MTTFALASYIVLAISLVLAIGGVWALLKQKVVIDAEGQPSAIEIPLFGKLKTNTPALVACFLGAGLAAFTVQRIPWEADKAPLRVRLTAAPSLAQSPIIIGVIPQKYLAPLDTSILSGSMEHDLNVDIASKGEKYNVVALQLLKTGPDGESIYRALFAQAEMAKPPEKGYIFTKDLK